MKQSNLDGFDLKLKLKFSELNTIWKSYCELHTKLYDLTCDEYVHLLSSDMDALEETLSMKNDLIELINISEVSRVSLINEINSLSSNFNILKISDVINLCKETNNSNEALYLEKYNALLLDIIEKIQDQNKLNQLFLNKAITSLKELKESFSGRKTYKTYGANGTTSSNSVSR